MGSYRGNGQSSLRRLGVNSMAETGSWTPGRLPLATTQTVSAGFVATHNQRPVLFLTCDSADRTSGAPHIQAGVRAGQLLLILVTDDANKITITDGNGTGTQLNGDWVVANGWGIGAKIWLIWDGTRWWEVDRKNGELVASGAVAHAEGRSTTASGNTAHAEGRSTTASGLYSHSEGRDTIASGSQSHAEGFTTTASGDYSHAQGTSSAASGDYSHVEGVYSRAALHAEHAQAAGRFSATGDAQRSVVVARISTTDATLTETFLDGVDDLLTILDEYTYACKIMVVGRQDTGVDHFMGTYHCLIQRTGGAPALVGAVDIIYENNAGGWGAGGGLPVSILAGATNLEVWVEGLAAHNIRWVVTVEMVRVNYAN